MNIEIQGDVCVASGKNWRYEQVGDLKAFTQTGKVPSLRVIKTIIKLMTANNCITALNKPSARVLHGKQPVGISPPFHPECKALLPLIKTSNHINKNDDGTVTVTPYFKDL